MERREESRNLMFGSLFCNSGIGFVEKMRLGSCLIIKSGFFSPLFPRSQAFAFRVHAFSLFLQSLEHWNNPMLLDKSHQLSWVYVFFPITDGNILPLSFPITHKNYSLLYHFLTHLLFVFLIFPCLQFNMNRPWCFVFPSIFVVVVKKPVLNRINCTNFQIKSQKIRNLNNLENCFKNTALIDWFCCCR